MKTRHASLSVGQVVQHKLFGYRGVIVDVDPTFESSDEWYEVVALSRPPKDRPWYHVLVHNATHRTYVAERNLEPDASEEQSFMQSSMISSTCSGLGSTARHGR